MKRRFYATLALLFATALTACGGGGGGGGSVVPAQPQATPTDVPLRVVSVNGSSITVTGQISALMSGGFYIQGGSGVGSLKIYTSSTTAITGGQPYVGEAVQVSGTGSVSTSINATSVSPIGGTVTATAAPLATASPAVAPALGQAITLPTGVVSVGGPVVAVSAGRFEIDPAHYGYMWVLTNSATTFVNGNPAVGQYALVTGSGTLGVSITANYVSLFQAAAVSATLSGTISAATPYGFMLNTGTATTPIALTSGTVALGTLNVGANVTISGTGSAAVGAVAGSISLTPGPAAPTPSPIPSVAPAPASVPAHVQTADYLWSAQEIATSPSTYAPYLTWAYPKGDRYGVTRAAGIKTVLYTNPLMPVPDNTIDYAAITGQYANLQATDCNGTTVRSYNGTGYLLNVMNSGAASYIGSVVQSYVNQINSGNPGYTNPIDVVFIDNANSFYGVSPMPCGYSASSWENGLDTALAGTPYNVMLNTLSVPAAQVPAQVAALQGSNVSGGQYEHCFADGQWTAEEQAQIQAIALLKRQGKAAGPGFWCYLDGTNADAASATAQRMFAYASFLLTYDPAYSVFQESYATPSTFKVMPETQFVPMYPMNAATDISSLQDAGGAYAQQYAYCYYRQSLVGSCEVVVNPGSSTVTVPNASFYTRSAVISGEDVLDGGTMTFAGAPVTTLAPGAAAVLVQ